MKTKNNKNAFLIWVDHLINFQHNHAFFFFFLLTKFHQWGFCCFKTKHGRHWNKGKPLSLCNLIVRATLLSFLLSILESRFCVGMKTFESSPLSKWSAKSPTSCSKHLPSSVILQSLSSLLEQQAWSIVVLARYGLNTRSVASCPVNWCRRCLRSRRQSTLRAFFKKHDVICWMAWKPWWWLETI